MFANATCVSKFDLNISSASTSPENFLIKPVDGAYLCGIVNHLIMNGHDVARVVLRVLAYLA